MRISCVQFFGQGVCEREAPRGWTAIAQSNACPSDLVGENANFEVYRTWAIVSQSAYKFTSVNLRSLSTTLSMEFLIGGLVLSMS